MNDERMESVNWVCPTPTVSFECGNIELNTVITEVNNRNQILEVIIANKNHYLKLNQITIQYICLHCGNRWN